MPATPRSHIFDPDTVGVYHCWSQLVRRAYLCGSDPLTGKDYSHRKTWIRDRLRELAGLMAIDVLDYAILDNHLHVVLRNRPDIVASWTDAEVALRWWHLCPDRRNHDGSPAEPTKAELNLLKGDPVGLAELRSRLSDISWLMRLLCQKIARRANKEDEVTGRFFAQRFGCKRILDLAGLLACSMYVDLNLIRAGMALTPETSEFTSVFDRIAARLRRQQRELAGVHGPVDGQRDPDDWLAPIFLDERPDADENPLPQGDAPKRGSGLAAGTPFPSPRASNKGFLPITLDQYLDLVDCVGRQLREDKRGSIPAHLAPILERLHIQPDQLFNTVANYPDLFHTLVGRAEEVRVAATRMGRRWVHGIRHCAVAFT